MQNALSNINPKIQGAEQGRRSRDEDFEKLSKLGSGSFGVVYMVRRKQDKKTYVMKVVETRKMSSNQKRESVLEATIMSKVHC
jgi:serine/threonine protein kinase